LCGEHPEPGPVCALQNYLDRSGPLRTHQPLKLPNDLSLRRFIAKYEISDGHGPQSVPGQAKKRYKKPMPHQA